MHMMRNVFHAAATVIVGPWNRRACLAAHAARTHDQIRTVLKVPTMLNSLLESPSLGSTDVSSMRLIGYGASPLLSATIREAMAAFKRPFPQMFGINGAWAACR